MKTNKKRIAVAITGASGALYALRLLAVLLKHHRVELMLSNPGRMVISQETGLVLPNKAQAAKSILQTYFEQNEADLEIYAKEDWMAPVASGSNPPDAMVICPCTTGTLGEIAAGSNKQLIDRAADVALKEQKKLILVIRETPFSLLHLENMAKLARAGAVIMPANPGFYHNPKTISDVVDYIVARILDHLQVEHDLMDRWGK